MLPPARCPRLERRGGKRLAVVEEVLRRGGEECVRSVKVPLLDIFGLLEIAVWMQVSVPQEGLHAADVDDASVGYLPRLSFCS